MTLSKASIKHGTVKPVFINSFHLQQWFSTRRMWITNYTENIKLKLVFLQCFRLRSANLDYRSNLFLLYRSNIHFGFGYFNIRNHPEFGILICPIPKVMTLREIMVKLQQFLICESKIILFDFSRALKSTD